jgi:hypothetical protein
VGSVVLSVVSGTPLRGVPETTEKLVVVGSVVTNQAISLSNPHNKGIYHA